MKTSKTKIELSPPFSLDWRFGYLVTNSENRKSVILYSSSCKRTTVSYARYLLSCREGRYLKPEEEADHINNDKTDDQISNLQILSKLENIRKQAANLVGKRATKPHGTLSMYRYCKCEVCRLGKKLYSSGKINEYRELVKSK